MRMMILIWIATMMMDWRQKGNKNYWQTLTVNA
jgi:hypothetical protein